VAVDKVRADKLDQLRVHLVFYDQVTAPVASVDAAADDV
jgi:hypothetical protein